MPNGPKTLCLSSPNTIAKAMNDHKTIALMKQRNIHFHAVDDLPDDTSYLTAEDNPALVWENGKIIGLSLNVGGAA